jgi:threonine dehydratase
VDLEITVQTIQKARSVLSSVIHLTPLEYSKTFSEMVGNEIYFKFENLQKTGSFKIRGAFYKISQLTPEQRGLGIVTASAGNHAQGVAFAARQYAVPAVVVMPKTAPQSKMRATEGYGAQVILHGSTYDEAYKKALEVVDEKKATYIHAFDDPDVIAGQGTVGLEVFDALPNPDAILVPVGGGGLISGLGIVAKALSPQTEIVGVQPTGAASSSLSWQTGVHQTIQSILTIADGLAVKSPGKLTFATMSRVVDRFVTVDEQAIKQAIHLLLERNKSLIEGAGAVGLAAMLGQKLPYQGKKIVIILSGGNIDVIKLVQHFTPNS